MAQKINLNSPSLLVFIATAASYGFAYCYEYGYLSFYGINTGFIVIAPRQIFTAVLVTLAALLAIECTAGIAKSISRQYDENNPVHRLKLTLSGLTVLLVAFIVLIASGKIKADPPLQGYVVVTVVYIALLMLLYYKTLYFRFFKAKTWHAALSRMYEESDREKEAAKSKETHKANIELNYSSQLFVPVLTVALISIACGAFGYLTAGYKNVFVTVVDSRAGDQQILVRENGSQMILKTFNVSTKKLKPGFDVVEVSGHKFESKVLYCSPDYLSDKDNANLPVRKACPTEST